MEALEANLDAFGANLDAPGASVERVLVCLEHAWAVALMCCAKRCDAVLCSSAVSVFCAMGCGIRATKQKVNRYIDI